LSIPSGPTVSKPIVIPIAGPNFRYRLEARIVFEELLDDNKFIARLIVDRNVDFILTLLGKQVEGGRRFEFGQFALNYRVNEPRPRAHFVASTLMTMLALSGGFQLKIPELQIDQTLNMELPLLEISGLLRTRQTAFRLMVIENATGVEFLMPESVSLADWGTLAFVYHAIVDRSFIWPYGKHDTSIPAKKESLTQFPLENQPFGFPQTITPLSEKVFGHVIDLGRVKVTTDDAVIRNPDAVSQEFQRNDGHLVTFGVESLSGRARYDCPEAPRWSAVDSEPKIKELIDLEPQLDAALFAGYNELAAATLAGLSDEERAKITSRPETGKAFVIEE